MAVSSRCLSDTSDKNDNIDHRINLILVRDIDYLSKLYYRVSAFVIFRDTTVVYFSYYFFENE